MEGRDTAEQLFRTTIGLIAGFELTGEGASNGERPSAGMGAAAGGSPLGGIRVDRQHPDPLYRAAAAVLWECAQGNTGPGKRKPAHADDSLYRALSSEAQKAREIFCRYYSRPGNREYAGEVLQQLDDPSIPREEKARLIATVWTPELTIPDEAITPRWKLSSVQPNPQPIQPTEIVIQFNALYTLPERIPAGLPADLEEEARALADNAGKKVAEYDHPVPLFAADEEHELVNCLDELDSDLDFEKKQGVVPSDYTMPVLLSVSVTHEALDSICGRWIKLLLNSRHYHHIRILVLTEHAVDRIKETFSLSGVEVYSVFGKYARHFNALKYTQLLLEKAYAIRAGFKLDTDEGIRSQEHFEATGETWLQTLCHPLWGGTALDASGGKVSLAINEGEYMNDSDIEQLGYAKALREPDVKPPSSFLGEHLFFGKAFVHARATALYNKFAELGDHISHPVVKGGGYGITNQGLREAIPFTYSQVGRAEDQQFYFTGLTSGIRGIFHPDLRVAHYKGAVALSERKTAASRFAEDLYRLVLFEHLVAILDIKEEIDPMPGVFAGELARAQAFFHLVHRALGFFNQGNEADARELLTQGRETLGELKLEIDTGKVRKQFEEEREQWKTFVHVLEGVSDETARELLDSFLV